MIKMQDIHKSYRLGPVDVEVLKGVNLNVAEGDLLAIVGSSGCGKSTLMNIMGFLDIASSGDYFFAGRKVDKYTDNQLADIRNKQLGFVFQQFHLLPRLTSLDNVCLPLVYKGMSKKQREKIGREMLVKVGMQGREKHKPTELSGGQQQRVAIARALSGSPSLILADEPTGALDSQTSREIMNLFLQLNQREKITIVIITHDPGIAKKCQRSVRMEDGLIFAGEMK